MRDRVHRDRAEFVEQGGMTLERRKVLATSLAILATSMLLVNVGVVVPSFEPHVEWSNTYKGVQYTYAYSAEQTSDGGYIISGSTAFNSSGSLARLVKTDPNGLQQWNRTYVQFANASAASVEQTVDGGYVFAGSQGEVYSHYPFFFVKTFPNGSVEWNRTYIAGAVLYVRQTSDSGFILLCAGALLLKTDSNGYMQWNKTLRGGFGSVQQTDDGGYILGGQTSTPWSDNALLLKTDPVGNIVWNRTYGPNAGATSVQQARDGGYVFATVTDRGTGSQLAWLVKVAPNGTTEWSRRCGTGNRDSADLVQLTKDGGYVVLGSGAYSGYWLAKMDSEGNLVWFTIFEHRYNGYEVGPVFAQQTGDGGYMVAGSAYHDSFWLAKLTEIPLPLSVGMYLALGLGTVICAVATATIMAERPRSRQSRQLPSHDG